MIEKHNIIVKNNILITKKIHKKYVQIYSGFENMNIHRKS